MNFAKIFLATTTLMVACISPTFAEFNIIPIDPSNPPSGDDKVEIIGVDYAGNGCPHRSAGVSISPDGQELRFSFNEFVVHGNSKPEERRKKCDLSIPIKVPQGKQIALYDADYRGYVAPNTTGKLRAEYFFAGSRGPKFTEELRGETEYNVRHDLESQGGVWSACGDSVNMRVNASMTAKGDGIATVDSVDLGGGLIYHLKYRNCQ